jgi:purine-binding chemotaxis protein CheW
MAVRKSKAGTSRGEQSSLPPMPPAGTPAPATAAEAAGMTLHGSLLAPLPVPASPVDPLEEFFLDAARDGAVTQQDTANARAPVDARERVLVFGLGREAYGVEIMGVREILKPPPLTEVPRAPVNVLGVFSLRGQVVPVMALASILGVAGEDKGGGAEARILVVGRGEDSVGFWVHRVAHVVKMDIMGLEPPPVGLPQQRRALLRGLGPSEDGLIILLDLPQLMVHLGLSGASLEDAGRGAA